MTTAASRRSGWKYAERRLSALLGAVRVPVTGRSRGDRPDGEHPSLSLEYKHLRSVPQWLVQAMAQAEAAARDGKVPTVVVHQVGRPYSESFVILKLRDFSP